MKNEGGYSVFIVVTGATSLKSSQRTAGQESQESYQKKIKRQGAGGEGEMSIYM